MNLSPQKPGSATIMTLRDYYSLASAKTVVIRSIGAQHFIKTPHTIAVFVLSKMNTAGERLSISDTSL